MLGLSCIQEIKIFSLHAKKGVGLGELSIELNHNTSIKGVQIHSIHQ
jgi:hypothetical protein